MFHNWASSFDATNYDPQYWQLRTNEGQSTASCQQQSRADGTPDTCMGARFYDPETDDEQGAASESRPGIDYFGHTSTMEYQQERFFETVGMGQYDVMTMGALYGRVLETLDPEADGGALAGKQNDYEWLNYSQLTEDNLVGGQPTHYTDVARGINVFDPSRCRDATSDEIAHAEWRIVHGKVCAPPPKDHAAWQDFVDGTLAGSIAAPKSHVNAAVPNGAGAGNVRWPYRFGQTDNAYVHINPFDSGADVYEVTRHELERFDYTYPFQYFRRQRQDWDYGGLPFTQGAHFFERLRSYHWIAARNNATAFDGATDDVTVANRLAEHDMIQGIVRALLLPQIGDMGTADESLSIGNGRPLFDAVQGGGFIPSTFSLDAATARFVDPDYDSSPTGGGSWNYLDWINHAGFDVEKSIASMALTDGTPTLYVIQRETYIDGRNVYINFRTDMARAVDRVLGGVLSNDWDTVAMYAPATDQQPSPQTMDFVVDAPTRSTNPDDVRLLFPNLGYIQQTWAAIWAQLFAGAATDLSLQNKLLIYLEGTQGVIEVPDAQKVKFSDPRSGFTYVARLYGPDVIDGKTVDSGVGSRMLKHANDLLALVYEVDKDSKGTTIVDQYGRPSLTLDANGAPIPVTTDATATKAFGDYVGLVDTSTQLSRIFGHGPL